MTAGQRLDRLLDVAPCGFLSFADDGVVKDINTTLLELLGYQRAEVIDRHVEQLLNIGTRIFYQTHWFPLLRLHGRAEEVFLMLRHKSGENVGMLSYARRREPEGVYDCVLVEVRERAKYEEELLRAKRLAEEQSAELEVQQHQLLEQAEQLEQMARDADEANRAKSSFLAMMSHELRTPLNAIGGYLQILELGIPGPVTEQQREILQRLDRSSRHLLSLINDVLDLSRIEAGHVTFEIEELRLAEVVGAVTPMVEPQLAEKRIALSVDVPAGLIVRADSDKLRQIILNLLGNALKFTPEGGRVDVFTAETEDSVELHVRDTGIGIPADKLDAIFQAFVQVDSGHTRTAKGSGLGLAISR
ncbi:MAG TPA: histidine kinase dimerization/phospho-acceptor domain-containing protein, partial [Longimicrobiales bacterium]